MKRPRAMREAGYGIKAATITPEGADDVGSPNRILREEIDGKVIIRTGRRIPGVPPLAGVHHPIAVVRMAVGTPTAPRRAARATRRRRGRFPHRARPPLRAAARSPSTRSRPPSACTRASTAGPSGPSAPCTRACSRRRWTPPPQRHPDVPYQPQLIDVTYAGLVGGAAADAPLVIPALNRDGDCLSELVLRLFGSIAGAESVLLSFDEDYRTRVVMTEAPHGTAPALEGKNVANPMAMILAAAALLRYIGDGGRRGRPRRLRGRSTRPCWRRSAPASGPRTSAGTPPRPSSPTRSSRACGPSSRSGPA